MLLWDQPYPCIYLSIQWCYAINRFGASTSLDMFVAVFLAMVFFMSFLWPDDVIQNGRVLEKSRRTSGVKSPADLSFTDEGNTSTLPYSAKSHWQWCHMSFMESQIIGTHLFVQQLVQTSNTEIVKVQLACPHLTTWPPYPVVFFFDDRMPHNQP